MTSEEPYGVRVLPELYRQWTASGMVANIGTRLVEAGAGRLVLEGNLTGEAHGFPTSRGTIVHGGAIATLADESLATVAFTVADATAVKATHADWVKRGLTIAQAPTQMDFGHTFVALDPDGHRLRVLASP